MRGIRQNMLILSILFMTTLFGASYGGENRSLTLCRAGQFLTPQNTCGECIAGVGFSSSPNRNTECTWCKTHCDEYEQIQPCNATHDLVCGCRSGSIKTNGDCVQPSNGSVSESVVRLEEEMKQLQQHTARQELLLRKLLDEYLIRMVNETNRIVQKNEQQGLHVQEFRDTIAAISKIQASWNTTIRFLENNLEDGKSEVLITGSNLTVEIRSAMSEGRPMCDELHTRTIVIIALLVIVLIFCLLIFICLRLKQTDWISFRRNCCPCKGDPRSESGTSTSPGMSQRAAAVVFGSVNDRHRTPPHGEDTNGEQIPMHDLPEAGNADGQAQGSTSTADGSTGEQGRQNSADAHQPPAAASGGSRQAGSATAEARSVSDDDLHRERAPGGEHDPDATLMKTLLTTSTADVSNRNSNQNYQSSSREDNESGVLNPHLETKITKEVIKSNISLKGEPR